MKDIKQILKDQFKIIICKQWEINFGFYPDEWEYNQIKKNLLLFQNGNKPIVDQIESKKHGYLLACFVIYIN